jgi:hypothetical protein
VDVSLDFVLFGNGTIREKGCVLLDDEWPKVVLCLPRGGFNDTLCQIEKCLTFAEETSRTLVIDSRESGLMGVFDEFLAFKKAAASVPILTSLTPELADGLGHLSVFPSFLNTEITLAAFLDLPFSEKRAYARERGYPSLKPSLVSDYPEDVVYYEGAGGGQASFRLLEKLCVSDRVVADLSDFSNSLPNHYQATHLRATDYRTDVEGFFSRLRKSIDGSPLYVATDNQEVFDRAKEEFQDVVFNEYLTTPIEASRPKHRTSEYPDSRWRHKATLQMFRDLFAVSGSSGLFYSLLDPETTGLQALKASGFSLLARHLMEKPDLFEGFFRLPIPVKKIGRKKRKVRLLAPFGNRYRYWRAAPFRHLPDWVRPRGCLKLRLNQWRGLEG